MDPETRRTLLDRYKDGYRMVADACDGASEKEMDAKPSPGRWSMREIIHHLADSEMTAAIRVRRLIAEDRPVIHPYDQDEYARRLHYDRPVAASLAAFLTARLSTGDLLDRLNDEEWTREGTHPEHGPYSVEKWLVIYAEHAHKHADQIRSARASAA